MEPFYELPLVGRVMAGKPVEVFEHQEAIQIPLWLLRGGRHFVMEVRGDSMIDDGIREGDLVIVQQQIAPNNGDTGVAVAKRCGGYPSGSVPSGHRRQWRRVRNFPSTGLCHHASSRSDRRHER